MTTQPPVYNANVPQFPSNSLPNTQPEFQDNFSKLFDDFAKNHVPLNASLSAGNHTIIQLLQQDANAGIQTDVGELSLYSKDVTQQTDQVFLEYQGQGQELQYTNYQIYKPENNDFQIKYFTFLPGKILVYFGTFSSTLVANVLDLFPYIARNIVYISLCPIGTTPTFKPSAQLEATKDGIYQGIKFTSSTAFNAAPPPCFYMVMANV